MTKVISLINELSLQKVSIEKQLDCGIISSVDATNELTMITIKERKLIKQLVLATHVTKDGKLRKITYQESKGLWYTIMPDKSKVYATSEDKLYEKLFEAYKLSISDYSFAGIFKIALDEKSRTDNNNQQTISHYRFDYDRFISDSFAQKDIRTITKVDLKEYTQTMVNKLHPRKKAFFAYKSVLNLAFRYALENEIIHANPLAAMRNDMYYKSCDITPFASEQKILSPAEIQKLKDTVRKYMNSKRYDGYFINGYAILFSIETGMRAGELPSLKWSDIKSDHIHIHSQQLNQKQKGGKEYYYASWTKNEKGIPRGGRKFPLTNVIKALLGELKELQTSLGIESEYIFCHEDGEWIKTDAYETCLRRMLSSLGFSVTNNHALRMSLNSNIFIDKYGIPVTERARLLGHSVETNLRHYSFAGKDNLQDICAILNGA